MRAAGLDLLRQRIPVVGRAALQRIGDEAVPARHPYLVEQLVEQLAGPPYERLALLVLVEAWRLAHEHQVRVRVAGAKHDRVPPLRERALAAVVQLPVELDQPVAAAAGRAL